MVKEGRFWIVGAEGSRRVGSMGEARNRIGGSIEAVMAVVWRDSYPELSLCMKEMSARSELRSVQAMK